MRNMILIGPRACGKSKVGRIIAGKFDTQHIDADRLFEAKHGTIADYVKQNGWSAFRERETEIIREVCGRVYPKEIVFSPGGGAVAHNQNETCRKENVTLLRDFGIVFYLLPYQDLVKSARILAQRIDHDSSSAASRPALNGSDSMSTFDTVISTLRQRNDLYRSAKHYMVLTGNRHENDVAKKIIDLYNSI